MERICVEAEINEGHEVQGAKPSLFGMVGNPGEQFERIKERPRFWVPLIVISLLSAVATALLTGAFDFDTTGLEGLSEDELQIVRMVGIISSGVIGLFIPVLTILISSAVLLLITTMVGTDAKFKQLLSMNTFIYIIPLIGLLLHAVVRLAVGGDPQVYATSLGSLVDVEGAAGSVLSGIEVFSIWSMVLTAIGLQKVAGLSKKAAWAVAIAFFVIGLLIGVVGASFEGMVSV